MTLDTGLKYLSLSFSSIARYLSIVDTLHNTEYLRVGKEEMCYLFEAWIPVGGYEPASSDMTGIRHYY